MTDCNICCEKLSKSVKCVFCDFECCSTCTRRYLLESESDPHCMNCKKQWSRDFIDASFPKTFVNKELKSHREELLLDKEKSLLPSTQPLVEQELHRRKYQSIVNNLYERRKELQNCLNTVNNDIRDAYTQLHYGHQEIQQKQTFTHKCPADDCMGYLSSQWKCGICNIWVCKDCHEIKGDHQDSPHTCVQSNIDTAQMITKETKPCPSCSTRIYKINGCDQMFCTECHTSFSWRSGQKVISGVIHNPHYYEWMRTQNNGQVPRQPGDIPCGGLPTIYELNKCIRTLTLPVKHKLSEEMFLIHRCVTHIQYTEIHRYEYREENNNINSDLRIRYMLNEITEDYLKNTLQKREKKNSKNLEISQILQMFLDTASDIFRTIIKLQSISDLENQIPLLHNLRKYMNKSCQSISCRYSCVVPIIYDSWVFDTLKN